MPELPEVETVVRSLAPLVTGQRLARLTVSDPRLGFPPAACREVAGRTVTTVFRLGKQVLLQLAPPAPPGGAPRWLCVHLRMTGRLLWFPAGEPLPPDRPPRATLFFPDGRLLFCDTRRFGTLRLLTSLTEAEPAGLEPLSPACTAARLGELLRGSRLGLKTWLLRQDRLVGIGNIYASEILFDCRLHPDRPAGSLQPAEVVRLHRSLRRILRRAIAACGTTFDSFQDAHAVSGEYQERLTVYGRGGKPCTRCRTPVACEPRGGRSTYWCPRCQ
ncbi:MAG: bifunctional DNA-formamidopyrimidine glycosylase/DNA-(apurinic or apyrimidinic site) lyase [Myxococcota bacterium]|jgi:formamidopyrimidine-DNA glycosylase|nr:bifunctional DNA-formamidopyrimidine glycosylase/DNA-(apurinic or apyrimidinic site) lyase [Myxococcota bacterium]